MAEISCWQTFQKTVEGRLCSLSSVFEKGKLAIHKDPLPRDSKPNLKLLSDVLRSEVLLPQEIRKWLADLVDEDAESEMQFKNLLISQCNQGDENSAVRADPLGDGSKFNLKSLIDQLRSEKPLSRAMRYWFADLVDEDAMTGLQFEKLSKRNDGPKMVGVGANWGAAAYYIELREKGVKSDEAFFQTDQTFIIKRSTLLGAVRMLKKAREEDAKIKLEEERYAEPNK